MYKDEVSRETHLTTGYYKRRKKIIKSKVIVDDGIELLVNEIIV